MAYPEKELIEEIVTLFEDYQEEYVPGEWEAFQERQRRSYPFFQRWMRVAGVMFLAGILLPVTLQDYHHTFKLAGYTVRNVRKLTGANKMPVDSPDKRSQLAATRLQKPVRKPAGMLSSPAQDGLTEAAPAGPPAALLPADAALATAVHVEQREITYQKDSTRKEGAGKQRTAEFLLAESRSQAGGQKKSTRTAQWDFGIQVMPLVTSSGTTVGAGLSTSYRVSPKLALSSGISIVQLASSSGPGSSADGAASFSAVRSVPDRQLLGSDETLHAIDIPVSLVFKINKQLYTSAGVSFFSIISEKRNSTFLQTAPVSAMAVNPATGIVSSYQLLQSSQVSQPDAESLLKGKSYLGFFNFSVGRQQNLFNKYRVQVEPFIKIPVGKLASEDLKLLNSGVKLQFAF